MSYQPGRGPFTHTGGLSLRFSQCSDLSDGQMTLHGSSTSTATHSSSHRVLFFSLPVLSAVGCCCRKLRLFGLLIQADPCLLVCLTLCVCSCTCVNARVQPASTLPWQPRQRPRDSVERRPHRTGRTHTLTQHTLTHTHAHK